MTDLFKGATGQLREDQGYCQVDLLNIYEGNYIVSARQKKVQGAPILYGTLARTDSMTRLAPLGSSRSASIVL